MQSAISPALARVFLHVVYMQSPDELQRTAILQWLSKKCSVNVSADLSHVAAEASGFLYADLSALVFHAIRYIMSQKLEVMFVSVNVCHFYI
jgi:SpoVK/Ycf46/Vps4 family AAA+-type ATPase